MAFPTAQLFLNDLERGGNSPLMRSTDGTQLRVLWTPVRTETRLCGHPLAEEKGSGLFLLCPIRTH